MKKKHSPLRTIILALVIVLLIMAAVLLGLAWQLSRRINAVTFGSNYAFDYVISQEADEPSSDYKLLEQLGALEGRMTGSTADGQYTLYLYPAGSNGAVTDFFIDQNTEQAYFNVRRIYEQLIDTIAQDYPLVGSLAPKWSLGDYVSQAQLNLLLNGETADASDEGDETEASESMARLSGLHLIQCENGLDGYLYFSVDTSEANGQQVIFGFTPRSLFSDEFAMHVIITDPDSALQTELIGSAIPADVSLEAPASLVSDENISLLREFLVIIQSISDAISARQSSQPQSAA